MIIKLKPAFKDYLWGGKRLKTLFDKKSPYDITAESWELSCHPDGMSIIAEGDDIGMTLFDWNLKYGSSVLGKNCVRFENFPILVKLIDATQSLSVQVHPDDDYALANENQYGKTEMWYIIDHEPGAFLYHGLSHDITEQEFGAAIENDTVTDYLRKVEVKKGDIFFIEAGTIHAIGAGIVIAEIQQNSNLTYRVFDYNRADVNGQKRQLHKDKVLEVSKLSAEKEKHNFGEHIAACKYFVTDKINIDGNYKGFSGEMSFHHILIISGGGKAENSGEITNFHAGDSLFISAESKEYELSGKFSALITSIPESGKY